MDIRSKVEELIMDLGITGVEPKVVLVNQDDYNKFMDSIIGYMVVTKDPIYSTKFANFNLGPYRLKLVITDVETPEVYGTRQKY